ncbi:MAG: phage head-tail connector protein [Robiginitomaculum sp.]|nr:phage head-tail connector protein [Robiginitomaculum sp.]
MAIKILVEPAIEPVTLAEAKAWLRLDHSTEDELITQLVRTARTRSEAVTSRAFITQTVQETGAKPSKTGVIELAVNPVQSVTGVSEIGPDNSVQILDASAYIIDLDQGRILLGRGHSTSVYKIQYIAGYGNAPSDVPAPLKTAILLQTAWLFERRDENDSAIPFPAQSLLARYRRVRL